MNKLAIWNLALSHLRAPAVGDAEENSAQAIACRTHYPVVKQEILTEAPWRFATAWVPLAEYADTVLSWPHTFQRPAGTLRVWDVRAQGMLVGPLEWGQTFDPLKNETVIGAKVSPVNAHITFDVDEALYPATLVDAVSHLLAARLATGLQGVDVANRTIQTHLALFASALNAASEKDAAEAEPEPRRSRHNPHRRY